MRNYTLLQSITWRNALAARIADRAAGLALRALAADRCDAPNRAPSLWPAHYARKMAGEYASRGTLDGTQVMRNYVRYGDSGAPIGGL